jgi:hypothetical protein
MLVGSTVLAAPALVRAQGPLAAPDSAGPRPGAWGAEGGIGSGQSATLLRFRSSTSAVLIGLDASWFDTSEELPDVGGTRTQRNTYANLMARIGVRGYQTTASAARPFTSVGVIAGYTQDPGGPGWTAGAFGELGASYFFSPHVSLGAAGGLQVTYSRTRREFSAAETLSRRQFGVQANAVRLLGAVYF